MRSNEVFARMTPAQAESFLADLCREAPPVARTALAVAAGAFKLRSQFLKTQPRARQAEWMRRALARATQADAAEGVLAEYFLGHQKEMLVEWLDDLGIAHENGVLENAAPDCPEPEKLRAAVEKFSGGENPERRALLLAAFAAQAAIEWPGLEQLLAGA